jgi:hypothetical protein
MINRIFPGLFRGNFCAYWISVTQLNVLCGLATEHHQVKDLAGRFLKMGIDHPHKSIKRLSDFQHGLRTVHSGLLRLLMPVFSTGI